MGGYKEHGCTQNALYALLLKRPNTTLTRTSKAGAPARPLTLALHARAHVSPHGACILIKDPDCFPAPAVGYVGVRVAHQSGKAGTKDAAPPCNEALASK
jgi:hypothetical protein